MALIPKSETGNHDSSDSRGYQVKRVSKTRRFMNRKEKDTAEDSRLENLLKIKSDYDAAEIARDDHPFLNIMIPGSA